ncbi:MAG: cation transporter [Eggerthellaceae bacterium]|nr:cation transporter [Eggerthellaceae bacterium]
MATDVTGQESQKEARTKRIERVLWIVLMLNLVVAAAKYFYGLASQSASMQADGIHSVFDTLGNVVGLIGITLAARPADEGHPYGHAKFETYGSLVIGVLLLLAAFEIGSQSITRLITGEHAAHVTPLSFAVMIGTLCVNVGVSIAERRAGNQLRSEILKADSAHTMSDALVSVSVTVGLVLVACGFPAADPIMALVVTVFILISAVGVFRRALRTLSDHSRIDADDIRHRAEAVDGVRQIHRVRTRGTESEVYVDLHLLVAPEMTVADAHGIGDKIERAVKRAHPEVQEVLVHIEPDTEHERQEE